MKTGCTSGKKNFVFTFHSVCTVFVPFKMEHFQSALTIRDLHNYKGVPYGDCIKISVSSNHIEFLNTDEAEHQEEILRLWEKRRKRLAK